MTTVVARFRSRIAWGVAGVPLPIAIVYLVSSALNVVAFAQTDISHTVGSSYAYLLGHPLDFYDYDQKYFVGNDYLPTVYIIFAIWMAPVKLLMSPGVQHGFVVLSPIETIWAKLLLLIAFWIAFYVVALIAKELFPDRPHAQTTAKVAFILSPIAGFALNVFGQYDIFGVLFVLLGFLFYLRNAKWRFALFMGLGLTSKYFAIVVFIPLLVFQFKKFREMIPVGLVAIVPLAIEVAVYLPNAAFRDYTLFGHAGSLTGAASSQPLTIFVGIIFAAGVVLLWRFKPTREQFGLVSVYTALMAYSLMLVCIAWNPQWFIVITPFAALAVGYLRRPVLFLVWESIFFVFFIWLVVHRFPENVDDTMVQYGALKEFIGRPHLLLGDIYPSRGLSQIAVVVTIYLISPLIFILFDRLLARRPLGDPRVRTWVWWVRVLTIPAVWTIPVIVALVVPLSVATKINPLAPILAMQQVPQCNSARTVFGPVGGGGSAAISFVSSASEIDAVTVNLATYAARASGTMTMTLTDSRGDVVATSKLDLAEVEDNGRAGFVIRPLKGTVGKRYVATFRSSPDASNVAFWGGDADCDPNGSARVNGMKISGDLLFSQYVR